jgi:hypothetical protein
MVDEFQTGDGWIGDGLIGDAGSATVSLVFQDGVSLSVGENIILVYHSSGSIILDFQNAVSLSFADNIELVVHNPDVTVFEKPRGGHKDNYESPYSIFDVIDYQKRQLAEEKRRQEAVEAELKRQQEEIEEAVSKIALEEAEYTRRKERAKLITAMARKAGLLEKIKIVEEQLRMQRIWIENQDKLAQDEEDVATLIAMGVL